MTMYLESSMKYFLHYIKKIRPKKLKSSFLFGKAMDEALNILLRYRDLNRAHEVFMQHMLITRINGKNVSIPESDLVDYTKKDFDEELTAHFNAQATPWDSLVCKGKLMIDTYYHEVLPNIKEVITVQKRVSLKNEVEDEIYGLLDAIVIWNNDKVYLIDNKTSSVKYTSDSVRESNQLALYHYMEKDEIKLDGAGFIVISKQINRHRFGICRRCDQRIESRHKTCNATKDGNRCGGTLDHFISPTIDIDYFFSEIMPEDEDRVITEFDKVNNAISNGVFECPGPSKCYTKFGPCIYRKFCECGDMEGLVDLGKTKEE
jgi:PD-(D/E)XK nuclease superfamily